LRTEAKFIGPLAVKAIKTLFFYQSK